MLAVGQCVGRRNRHAVLAIFVCCGGVSFAVDSDLHLGVRFGGACDLGRGVAGAIVTQRTGIAGRCQCAAGRRGCGGVHREGCTSAGGAVAGRIGDLDAGLVLAVGQCVGRRNRHAVLAVSIGRGGVGLAVDGDLHLGAGLGGAGDLGRGVVGAVVALSAAVAVRRQCPAGRCGWDRVQLGAVLPLRAGDVSGITDRGGHSQCCAFGRFGKSGDGKAVGDVRLRQRHCLGVGAIAEDHTVTHGHFGAIKGGLDGKGRGIAQFGGAHHTVVVGVGLNAHRRCQSTVRGCRRPSIRAASCTGNQCGPT